MRKSWLTAASVLAVAAVEGQPAHATFILDTSCGVANCAAGDHLNLNAAMDTTTGSGVVDGTTVNFTTSDKVDVANGFADIEPAMGASDFTSITFTPTSDTQFDDFSFRGSLAAAGTVDVMWTASDGATGTIPFTGLPANADFGRLGIVSNDGETLASVTLDSSGFKDVRQIEFSPAPVPEPVTLTLLGTGLLGLGLARRLRRKT
jgi:PEP-CTERM motif